MALKAGDLTDDIFQIWMLIFYYHVIEIQMHCSVFYLARWSLWDKKKSAQTI